MINPIIIDKIKKKCKDDTVLIDFIIKILNLADGGKHYTKSYTKYVDEALKEIEKNEV